MLADIVYDGELSGTAYAILFVVMLIIFGGLAWCFHRALKAAEKTPEPQLPDDSNQ